jgi:DNA topoisomerase II
MRPDTYVGSCEPETKEMWIYDAQKEKIVQKNITYVPGLYKIFGK